MAPETLLRVRSGRRKGTWRGPRALQLCPVPEQLSHEATISISPRYGPASNPDPPTGHRVPEAATEGQKRKGQTF